MRFSRLVVPLLTLLLVGAARAGEPFSVSPTDLARALPYTNWSGKGYGVTIARHFRGAAQEKLLARAEAIYPARDEILAASKSKNGRLSATDRAATDLWWWSDFDGVRLPYAVTSGAVHYYRQKVHEFRRGDFRASKGIKMTSASLKYDSSIEPRDSFTQGERVFENVWVARLKLEWSQYCGNVCAMGFSRERTVVMSQEGAVLSVSGDGAESVIVS